MQTWPFWNETGGAKHLLLSTSEGKGCRSPWEAGGEKGICLSCSPMLHLLPAVSTPLPR